MTNKAAWLTAAKARPFKVDDAPMPMPSGTEIVVRNHAVAINPVDWAIQATGMFPLPYPAVLGLDAAGQVTAVGESVSKFKIGDRVVTSLDPFAKKDPRRGAFQLYSLAREEGTAKLPDSINYSEAAVLPLAVSTSASALFQEDTLGLQLPMPNATPTGKVVLIWGGSTSLGACAIQLVVAAGYEVATTASAHNLDAMKAIGAKFVYDHTKETVADDIITDLKHLDFGGAYCAVLTTESIKQCAKIAREFNGKKLVQTVLGVEMPFPEGLPEDIAFRNVYGTSLLENEVGTAIWGNYIPEALAAGSFKCVPPPLIFGEGLDAIQGALDRWKEGVSYQKVVVELP
ncbi:hypothetical protein LTR84_000816 [Exophiala bonariae]|uniref:Enoyl reductase (ER) domain-containing protein n=1 Tax=Exophiala bonariae TaxID=1690606 RepID=A0AAV9NSP4_9EURO|nr:hypothetical protein LTR84_000816 [Exophiala bonariae]